MDIESEFDRQIRLWGHQAQHKLITLKIIIADLGPFTNELAKNLKLAGVGCVCIHHKDKITEFSIDKNFLDLEADEKIVSNIHEWELAIGVGREVVFHEQLELYQYGENLIATYIPLKEALLKLKNNRVDINTEMEPKRTLITDIINGAALSSKILLTYTKNQSFDVILFSERRILAL